MSKIKTNIKKSYLEKEESKNEERKK